MYVQRVRVYISSRREWLINGGDGVVTWSIVGSDLTRAHRGRHPSVADRFGGVSSYPAAARVPRVDGPPVTTTTEATPFA